MTPVVHIDSLEGVEAPDDDSFSCWVTAALAATTAVTSADEPPELSIRVTDREEMAALNLKYRGKAGATNVLSFPTDLPPDVETGLLGDIVICAPLVCEQAVAQHKSARAHWAHLTVHGVLHLLGYDHMEDHEAETMEALEVKVLSTLGFSDPYQVIEHGPHGGKVAS